MLGAHSAAMRALVLAGLPTTSTLTVLEATVLRYSPYKPQHAQDQHKIRTPGASETDTPTSAVLLIRG